MRVLKGGAPQIPQNLESIVSGFFENLTRIGAFVEGFVSTCFVFCYSITRRRTDPGEGQLTRLTVAKAPQDCVETWEKLFRKSDNTEIANVMLKRDSKLEIQTH